MAGQGVQFKGVKQGSSLCYSLRFGSVYREARWLGLCARKDCTHLRELHQDGIIISVSAGSQRRPVKFSKANSSHFMCF